MKMATEKCDIRLVVCIEELFVGWSAAFRFADLTCGSACDCGMKRNRGYVYESLLQHICRRRVVTHDIIGNICQTHRGWRQPITGTLDHSLDATGAQRHLSVCTQSQILGS